MEQRGNGHGVKRLMQQDHEERAKPRKGWRHAWLHFTDSGHAGGKRHAFQQRVQSHADRSAGPGQPSNRRVCSSSTAMTVPGVIMRSVMVPLVPVHRIIARWLRQFMLMEMRKSLQEEHRQESKRQRHHQRIEQPVWVATSRRRFHARHQRVRHHVKERYSKHDARNEAQSKLQSSMREAQDHRHHAARKGGHHNANAEDDESGFGTHGSAGNARRSSPSHRGRGLHDTAAPKPRNALRRPIEPDRLLRPTAGVVAQLEERLGRIEEVVSSILIHST